MNLLGDYISDFICNPEKRDAQSMLQVIPDKRYVTNILFDRPYVIALRKDLCREYRIVITEKARRSI